MGTVQAFSTIGELGSIIPSCVCLIALTATAARQTLHIVSAHTLP